VTSIYDIDVSTIDGGQISLGVYRGKTLLIVNVASECGYTPQYAGLESMFRRHAASGLVVLGFPCNQFGRQEPGSDADIKAFCSSHYAVTFPMFSKINVNGPGAHPLYKFLTSQKKGMLGQAAIPWNFSKFLISKEGDVVRRYAARDTPEAIEKDVVALLSIPT
jgi:glutathione peroxidase